MWFTPFPTFMTQDFWLFLAETEDQAEEKHMLIFDELVSVLFEDILV